jgi:hypothetical protein
MRLLIGAGVDVFATNDFEGNGLFYQLVKGCFFNQL